VKFFGVRRRREFLWNVPSMSRDLGVFVFLERSQIIINNNTTTV
jgi:hypothetical protein